MSAETRAAIYCRVSTEEQAREGFSIAAQKRTLEQFCIQRGWSIAGIYTDEGLSGKNTERPAFRRILNDASQNLFDIVLVWKINRFSRRNSDLLNTVEYLERYNVNLVSCSEQFDASTPAGKLMLSMLGSIGEFERNAIVENIRSGMSEKARQGFFNGGRVLGYDMKDGFLIINEDEAATVRKIFSLYLNGYTLSRIRDLLDSTGRRTKNNSRFEISSIKRILQNPIYCGYITYNKTRKVGGQAVKCSEFLKTPGKHNPIVSLREFDDVQQAIGSGHRCHNSRDSFLLSGILKCPYCGGRMTGCTKGKNKKYRYYVCSAYRRYGTSRCRGLYLNADYYEFKVSSFICSVVSGCASPDEICKRLPRSSMQQRIHNEVLSSLKKDLSANERSIKKYMLLFEENILSGEALLARVDALEGEINSIKQRISLEEKHIVNEAPPLNPAAIKEILSDFDIVFERLDCSAKKSLVNSIIDEIWVGPDGKIESIKVFFSHDCMRYTGYNVKCDVNTGDSRRMCNDNKPL